MRQVPLSEALAAQVIYVLVAQLHLVIAPPSSVSLLHGVFVWCLIERPCSAAGLGRILFCLRRRILPFWHEKGNLCISFLLER